MTAAVLDVRGQYLRRTPDVVDPTVREGDIIRACATVADGRRQLQDGLYQRFRNGQDTARPGDLADVDRDLPWIADELARLSIAPASREYRTEPVDGAPGTYWILPPKPVRDRWWKTAAVRARIWFTVRWPNRCGL